jgi:hypothetical protein
MLAGKTPRSYRGGQHVKNNMQAQENKHLRAQVDQATLSLEVTWMSISASHYLQNPSMVWVPSSVACNARISEQHGDGSVMIHTQGAVRG